MDVLKPPMVRVGRFCYRLNVGDVGNGPKHFQSYDELEDEQHHHSECSSNQSEAVGEVDSRVKKTGDKTFTASLNIPSALFKFVIGRQGDTRRRIEHETKCKVSLPPKGQEGYVVMRGAEAAQVSSALTRIELITDSGRAKQGFTHFISIPVNAPHIQDNFLNFKENVLKLNSALVDESIFQNPQKLHLTIGTMTLLNQAEINMAAELLSSASQSLTRILGDSARLSFQGLAYMNDDPSAVDVLYAKVKLSDDSNRLQEAVQELCSSMDKLLNKDYARADVKLHLTLMNTLFRKNTASSSAPNRKTHQRVTFDASQILKGMADYKFGEVDFPGFHLSMRYSTSCDGYYESVTSICTPSPLNT